MTTVPTVVVTGASSGIGRAAALRMDERGWRVLAGVRREPDADALRRDGSPRLRPVFLDVTDERQIEDAAATVGESLDGLVNNAGIAVGAPLEFLPIDEFRKQLEINVVGQLAVTQALLPALRRARGRIVNIGSIAGRNALPLVGAYSASKHALEAMTDALRIELRPWAMHVAIIEPGAVRTAIWERSLGRAAEMMDGMPERVRELYGRIMDTVIERAGRSARDGMPAERVANAIEHALTARRPKTRYLLGRDARVRMLLQRLPDRWRDRLIAAALGQTKRGSADVGG